MQNQRNIHFQGTKKFTYIQSDSPGHPSNPPGQSLSSTLPHTSRPRGETDPRIPRFDPSRNGESQNNRTTTQRTTHDTRTSQILLPVRSTATTQESVNALAQTSNRGGGTPRLRELRPRPSQPSPNHTGNPLNIIPYDPNTPKQRVKQRGKQQDYTPEDHHKRK